MVIEELPASFPIGTVVDGRYELRRDLGEGAAGLVFEAVHLFTGRRVALKLLAPYVPTGMRTELRARLGREARALAAVRHPGIVDVLDGGTLSDGTPFVVMDLLEGRTLEGLIAARGRVSVEDTVALGVQLCAALGAAHDAGVVHRDIKPSNLIIVRDYVGGEVVKVVDFGIAQVAAPKEDKLTGLGATIGTPEYMSPEQLIGVGDVDARSDVYSLGVTLFECLTGVAPYVGTYAQILLQVCTAEPPPSLDRLAPGVPKAVSELLSRALAKAREDRFNSMAELALALEASIPAVGGRRRTTFLGAPVAAGARAAGVQQRRKLPRASYVTPVRLVVGDRTIDGRTEDISTGGVLIICHQICTTDSRGALRFALPTGGKLVAIDVHVRWVRAAREDDPTGPRALGLEFIDPSDEVTSSIAQYVKFMTVPDTAK